MRLTLNPTAVNHLLTGHFETVEELRAAVIDTLFPTAPVTSQDVGKRPVGRPPNPVNFKLPPWLSREVMNRIARDIKEELAASPGAWHGAVGVATDQSQQPEGIILLDNGVELIIPDDHTPCYMEK